VYFASSATPNGSPGFPARKPARPSLETTTGGRGPQLSGRRIEHGVHAGAHLLAVERAHEARRAPRHLCRRPVLECIGAQRDAQVAHHRRGADPAPDHVADRHPHPPAGQGDHLVPVPADLHAVAPCQVAPAGRHARDVGRLLGQEVVLERPSDPALALVEAGVLDRHRRHVGELHQYRLIVLRELALALARQRYQAAGTPAAIDQGGGEPVAVAERSLRGVGAVGRHVHRRALGADDGAGPLADPLEHLVHRQRGVHRERSVGQPPQLVGVALLEAGRLLRFAESAPDHLEGGQALEKEVDARPRHAC
jgi:hypothetical protein